MKVLMPAQISAMISTLFFLSTFSLYECDPNQDIRGSESIQRTKSSEGHASQQQPEPPLEREKTEVDPPLADQQQQLHTQAEQYQPDQPQHQEHLQQLHELEKQRQALQEQQIREQQMRVEHLNQLLKQEQERAEQEKQQFKTPLHDNSVNLEQKHENSMELMGQPVSVQDDSLIHKSKGGDDYSSSEHFKQDKKDSVEDEEFAETDESAFVHQNVHPLSNVNEQEVPDEKADHVDPSMINTLPAPPLHAAVSPPAKYSKAAGDKGSNQAEDVKDRLVEKNKVPETIMPPVLAESDTAGNTNEAASTPDVEEITKEQNEGEKLFQAGEKLINATYYKEYKEAYLHFLQASELNHKKAKEYVAFGFLFGDYLPQNVSRAAELFVELADNGSPKAQMGLAFMHSAGINYNSSQAKALIFSTFGALGGDPLAQMALGYRYYAGIGVESKCETALTYYRKVATKVSDGVTVSGGPVVQRIRLQEETENQGTSNSPLLDDDLLQYYHFLADKGDQQAQVVLGTLYYQGGKGVQINHDQAYHYFSTAAEAGSGHAMGYLGKMHSEGSPVVKQSNETAFSHFKQSADKNNHIGQAGLGLMYLNGLGVEKDSTKAFRYFSLAADQGSVDGQLQLGMMYFYGLGVRKDYKMAVKYFTMASQNGHVLAFFNLAQMHATGTGVLRNCHTAVELFKNVAERGRWSEQLMDAHRMYHDGSVDTALVKYMFLAELGYEVAQSNVAYILDTGATDKFSHYESQQRALLQFSRAASQGSTNARLKMGDYHYYGLGTEIDYESAASHYRMASEQQHNAQAMFNLGYMHEQGLGLKQDVHLAKRFYDMAAETSIEAHVPVALALVKLAVFYGLDVFSKEFEGLNSLFNMVDPAQVFGPEWDLYLASVLSVIIGIILFLRRR